MKRFTYHRFYGCHIASHPRLGHITITLSETFPVGSLGRYSFRYANRIYKAHTLKEAKGLLQGLADNLAD